MEGVAMLKGGGVKPKSDAKRTIVSPNLGTRHIDFIGTWTTIHVKGQINSIQFSVIGHTNLLRNKSNNYQANLTIMWMQLLKSVYFQ